MGIKKTRLRGKVKIRGRPTEQARAEIMIMKAEERFRMRKSRRNFFLFLDTLAVISFIFAFYFFYINRFREGGYILIVGLIIIFYFAFKSKQHKRKIPKRTKITKKFI